jgi:Fe-S cluster assembly iron-binding protein IscA
VLQLSTEAATFVRALGQADGMRDCLLRVAPGIGNDDTDVELSLVARAEPGDQIGESNGVIVCVAGVLSASLDATFLDIQRTRTGRGLVLRTS